VTNRAAGIPMNNGIYLLKSKGGTGTGVLVILIATFDSVNSVS